MGHPQSRTYPYPDGEIAFTEIADGVVWLYMDKTHNMGLDNINICLLEDTDGWFMVDTGPYTEKTLLWWEKVLKQPMKGKDIKRILVTHFHPDHIGMAGWFAEHTSVEFLMAREEYLLSAYLYADVNGEYQRWMRSYYEKHGMDEETLSHFGTENGYRKMLSGMPNDFIDLSQNRTWPIGDREWGVILGSGHSYAHVCLYNADLNLLLAGDHVIQDRTPSLMLPVFERNYNSLERYWHTLDTLHELPDDTVVVPSHGRPFVGLHEEIGRIKGKMEHRQQTVLEACTPMSQAWDVFRRIHSQPRRGLKLKFAFEACMAYLIDLQSRGKVKQEEDADGFRYFQRQEKEGTDESVS